MIGFFISITALMLIKWQDPSHKDAVPLPTPSIPVQTAADIASLREILNSRQRPQEQSQAALQLLQLNRADADSFIRQELNRWERPDVFTSLAAAIRMQRDNRFLADMLNALGSESPHIRQAAIDTLASISPQGIEENLVALAEKVSARPLSRQGAVMALGNCGTRSAVASLIRLLRSDSQIVRQAAVSSLREISELEFGADPYQWKQWWEPFAILTEAEWQANRMRLYADRSRRLRDELNRAESALREVNKSLFDKVPRQERSNHLRSLANSDYPTVRDLSVTLTGELLRQPDVEKSERQALVDIILLLSRDPHELVRQHSVTLLDRADTTLAFDWLTALLHDRSAKVRIAAARTLGKHPQAHRNSAWKEQTRRILESALNDPIPAVAAAAVESIGQLNCPGTARQLVSLLKPTMPEEVRKAASEAVVPHASCAILQQLLAALEDAHSEVRFYVVPALGQVAAQSGLTEIQKRNVVQRIVRVLVQDRDAGVRSRAAYVLGEVGTPYELSVLWQSVREGEDTRVQERSWNAIIEIIVRQQSTELLKDWDDVLKKQSEGERRLQLLTETREQWQKSLPGSIWQETLQILYLEACLDYRRWQLALPIAMNLARSMSEDQKKSHHLQRIYRIAQLALEDHKPAEAAQICKDVLESLSPEKEIAQSFFILRGDAEQQLKNK